MTKTEKLMISKNDKVCYNCKHFWQHYIYSKNYNRFETCNAVHCTEPRPKNRKPNHKAYEHFEQRKEEHHE